MKEFMLLIRNNGDGKAGFSEEQTQQFLKGCTVYIEQLKSKGQLISAQPLVRDGTMVSCPGGTFMEGPYDETKEIIVGYYHILAETQDEAIAIAKMNPEFAFVKGAKIEVRPVKMVEASTSYAYPGGA
jgi:hypothetical protein